MSSFNLDEVTKALQGASVKADEDCGVSFEGKNFKLNTAEDAKPIVDAIIECKQLGYLNLAGNTLGVEAAAALAKALEKHPEFKRALWKDMFTGRLKEEIPKALEHLGKGLVAADARLTELDLSDNAFGPIGVAGLAALLRSRACFALHALRLNNNGLGIGGGRMLAQALTDCLEGSKKEGTPLQLKVFIAGRNRLENEGAKALAKVFEKIGTFEEIAMPQNGIYHIGITALSEAFSKNINLQVLNLNDNTVGPKGSKALAKALTSLQQLRHLNLGDCLLKNKGAQRIAEAIEKGHTLLEEVNMEANEIRASGGMAIARSVINKPNISRLLLDGNQFGSVSREEIRQLLDVSGHGDALAEFEEDESDASEDDDDTDSDDDDDDDDDDEDEEEEEEEDDDDEEKSVESEVVEKEEVKVVEAPKIEAKVNKVVTVDEFLQKPIADNFIALGDDKINLIVKAATISTDTNKFLDHFIPVLMKVSSLASSSRPEVSNEAISVSDALYREVFAWAQRTQHHAQVNNALLVHLGLIKSEDKKFKPEWNLDGCLTALESVVKQRVLPIQTIDTLKVFMGRCSVSVNQNLKSKLISELEN